MASESASPSSWWPLWTETEREKNRKKRRESVKRKRDVQKEGDIGMANGNVRTKKEERICIVFDSFGGEGLGGDRCCVWY